MQQVFIRQIKELYQIHELALSKYVPEKMEENVQELLALYECKLIS